MDVEKELTLTPMSSEKIEQLQQVFAMQGGRLQKIEVSIDKADGCPLTFGRQLHLSGITDTMGEKGCRGHPLGTALRCSVQNDRITDGWRFRSVGYSSSIPSLPRPTYTHCMRSSPQSAVDIGMDCTPSSLHQDNWTSKIRF